jgi:hypothetical protein
LISFIHQNNLIKVGDVIWWTRGWACNSTEEVSKENDLIEEKIKDWIIIFLKERREEWALLLEKESIEKRNLRLLDEVESLLRQQNII